jgi:hypothetical protein
MKPKEKAMKADESDAMRVFSLMFDNAHIAACTPSDCVIWNTSDADRVPPCPGVYVAFCEDGQCEYVGSSVCVGRRVEAPGIRDELRNADYVAVIPVEDERMRIRVEFYLIGLLNPRRSGQLKSPVTGSARASRPDLEWVPECRGFSVRGSSVVIRRDGKVVRS